MSISRLDTVKIAWRNWASVIAMNSIRPVEVAMVGTEGLVGLSVILGASLASNNCLMQTRGSGHRIATERFHEILPHLPILRQRMLSYVRGRLLQAYEAVVTTLADERS